VNHAGRMMQVVSMCQRALVAMMAMVTVRKRVGVPGHLRGLPASRKDHSVLELGERPRERRHKAMLSATRSMRTGLMLGGLPQVKHE
jgi:hypothetical protein